MRTACGTGLEKVMSGVKRLPDLSPDNLLSVAEHLCEKDLEALASASKALRAAVFTNERLWNRVFQRFLPVPWKDVADGRQPLVDTWRKTYLVTKKMCRQVS